MANKAGVPGSVRRALFRDTDYTCAECGIKGYEKRWPSGAFTHPTSEDGVYLSIDHIKPRAKGGASDRENLRVVCTTCNTRKGVK